MGDYSSRTYSLWLKDCGLFSGCIFSFLFFHKWGEGHLKNFFYTFILKNSKNLPLSSSPFHHPAFKVSPAPFLFTFAAPEVAPFQDRLLEPCMLISSLFHSQCSRGPELFFSIFACVDFLTLELVLSHSSVLYLAQFFLGLSTSLQRIVSGTG